MKTNKLLVTVAICLLLTSSFAAFNAFAAQPPITQDTWYAGTIGQPRRLDPARAYDTASAEIIMNVYEGLIFFDDYPVIGPPTSPSRSLFVDLADYANLASFKPQLASMPVITDGGLTWTFTMNTNAIFHPWTAANGSAIPSRNITAADVEYSIKRMLVQDMIGAPSWMLSLPGTGYMWVGYENDANTATKQIDPISVDGAGERKVRDLIDGLVTTSGNDVIFHWAAAWPEVAIKQILGQTWGYIGNKDFAIEHGCWDGSFADGWSANFRQQPSNSYGPLDRHYAAFSKYPAGNPDVPNMCGTGPYKFTSWDQANKVVRMDYFPQYWQGWANAGDKAGNYLKTVIIRGIDAWPTRKMLFLEGEFDVCYVPRANMFDLLESFYQPIEGINLYYGQAGLSLDASAFVLEVEAGTPYMPKVLGTAVPDFFNNSHTRDAFCFAVNFTEYLAEAWFGEAIQPNSWWVEGLQPAAAKNTALVSKTLNATRIEEELKLATYAGITGNLWTNGFEVDLCYNLGNDQRKIACDLMASTFATLGSKYKVNVVGLDWPVFLDYEEEFFMPMFFVGWLADFAHPDNFARPYMHTYGDFSYYQRYSNPVVDALIDGGIVEQNETKAIEMYQELQQIYYDDAIGLPIAQATGRTWFRDWVRGYYYNQLYPGVYYAHRYKVVGSLESVDLDITGSITPVVSYAEVYWYGGQMLVGNGDPTPAVFTFDIHVERTDANGNIATLTAVVGLSRTDGTIEEFPNNTIVLLGTGSEETVTLDWWEDGSLPNRFPVGTWDLGGRTGTVTSNAQDSNTANNVVADGSVVADGPLTGDIKVDGIVDIFDAIQLANAYGKGAGDTGFNSNADINGDSIIDIFDAILLAGNFNKHIP